MAYRTKLLLSKNNGDWRRRSAIVFKARSTLTFSEFIKKCAEKVYSTEITITDSTEIQLYQLSQNGLIRIDDEAETVISELHESGEIYQNCQILVILPSIHKKGIVNPSKEQQIELQTEQQLTSYLSTSSTASHSVYAPSSAPFDACSVNSSPRRLTSLASLQHNSVCFSFDSVRQPIALDMYSKLI